MASQAAAGTEKSRPLGSLTAWPAAPEMVLAARSQQGAFKDNTAVETPKVMVANTGNETTVEVISHPTPEYTPEAKQLKIQGDVVLEVRFSADGRCHVIRVVRGLGHGLDEQAIRVAEATHFKPATRDGRPVDITTYYRIDFQLA